MLTERAKLTFYETVKCTGRETLLETTISNRMWGKELGREFFSIKLSGCGKKGPPARGG